MTLKSKIISSGSLFSYCEEDQCTQYGAGVILGANEGLTSPNGISKFEVREDGNLILKCKNKEIWKTDVAAENVADLYLAIQV